MKKEYKKLVTHKNRKLYHTKYEQDLYTLKSYNNEYFKLVLLRTKCNEIDLPKKEKLNTNESKLSNNLSRASTNILEIALCNEWDLFFTGTIDPNKYDRTKFDAFYKDFSRWLRNYNYKKGLNIKYILIPELHIDKENWHMHRLTIWVTYGQASCK